MKAPTLFKKFMNLFSSSKKEAGLQNVRHAVTPKKEGFSQNKVSEPIKKTAETMKSSVTKNSTASATQKKKSVQTRRPQGK